MTPVKLQFLFDHLKILSSLVHELVLVDSHVSFCFSFWRAFWWVFERFWDTIQLFRKARLDRNAGICLPSVCQQTKRKWWYVDFLSSFRVFHGISLLKIALWRPKNHPHSVSSWVYLAASFPIAMQAATTERFRWMMDETPQQRTGAVLGGRKVSLVPFNVRWVYGTSNMLYVIFVHVSIWSISDHSLCLMLQPRWFGVSPLFCICMFSHMIEAQGNRWPVFLDPDFRVEEFDLVISISALPNAANLDAGQLTQHHPSVRNRRQPLR